MVGDVRLIRSPLSVAGMVLTTISAVLFLVVFFADLFVLHTNPYIGIIFFLVLPALFVLGRLVIPLGAWVGREANFLTSLKCTLHPSRKRSQVCSL